MKVAIIGSGGVGGYFGGKLAVAGHDVIFVARGAHLAAIREKGLRVASISGDLFIERANATNDIHRIGRADLVILGVKAWQVREIAGQVDALVGDRTIVLPLQNGVAAARELAEAVDGTCIVGGLCRIISRIESPGVIRHSGLEPHIAFGELDGRRTERTEALREMFACAGIAARVSDDIHADLWKKFMAICVSGLLAVTRSPYGVVRELKGTRAMMRDLLREVYEVSFGERIRLGRDAVEETVRLIDSYPYEAVSSLTRDVMEGRPSEIEYQNGEVVRLGERHHIHVPVNRFIYRCILPMELAARAKATKEIHGE